MKKIKFSIIIFIAIAVLLSFTCFAADEETPTPDIESLETTEQTTLPDSMNEADAEAYWEQFKSKITDSAVWTMIIAAILTVLGNTGICKLVLNKVISLVTNKADNETVKSELKDLETKLTEEYAEKYKETEKLLHQISNALKTTDENEQKLYTILVLFMTNCKIPESAKTEILEIITGVKSYSGELFDIVAQAQEAIDKAREEKLALAEPTPTLDSMIKEETTNNYMELG